MDLWDDIEDFEDDEYDTTEEYAILHETSDIERAADKALRARPTGLAEDMLDDDDRIYA